MASLADILSGTLDAVSAPGRYTRGALAGRPGQSMGGRDMLESWGVLGDNQAGLDTGDVLGFLAEAVVDPLNLIPVGALGAALGLSRKALPLSKGLMSGAARAAIPAVDDMSRVASSPAATRAASMLLPEGQVALATDILEPKHADLLRYAAASESKRRAQNFADAARLGEFRRGADAAGEEYMAKLFASGGDNVINPHSGMRLWNDADLGRSDLADVFNGRIPSRITPEEGNATSAWFRDGRYEDIYAPGKPILDYQGRPVFSRTHPGGPVITDTSTREFGVHPFSPEHPVDARPTGFHESLHAIAGNFNMSDELWKYLGSLKDHIANRAEEIPSLKSIFKGHDISDYFDEQELFPWIASPRNSLRAAGHSIQLPKIYNPSRRIAGIGPTANNDMRLMFHLMGRDKLNEGMKYVPALLAGPAAAAVYGSGE